MRCMSCGANIPPEWVMAIQKNECPGCGGEIMGSATKDLLSELTEAMKKMPNDPQGVAGWLLSNYRFQKIGSAEPVDKFHRKGGNPGTVDENNLKIAPGLDDFVKRNNAVGLVQRGEQLAKLRHSGNEKLAQLASVIQSEGVADPYGDDTSTLASDNSQLSADEQRAYLELKASGIDPFAQTPVGGITDMSQVINPNEVANLIQQGQSTMLKEEIALSQTEEGRRFLQLDRLKRIKAQDGISGGNGLFRR